MLLADQADDLSFPLRKKVPGLLLLRVEFTLDDEGGQAGGSMFAIEDIPFADGTFVAK